MNIAKKAFFVLCLLLLVPVYSQEKIIATYDGGTITTAAIREYMIEFKDYRESMLVKYPYKSNRDPVVAHKMVYDRMLAKMAVKTGVNRSPQVVDKLHLVKNELLSRVYIENNISKKVTVTEQEIHQRYLDRIKRVFTLPDKWVFRYIFINQAKWDTDSTTNHTYSRATLILSLAKQGKPFDELAKEYSDADKAPVTGGLVGPLEAGSINPSLDSALRTLSPGEITGLIKIPIGYQILQLNKFIPSMTYSYATVHNQIKEHMIIERSHAAIDAFINKVKSDLNIQTNYDELGKPNLPPETIILESKITTLRWSDVEHLVDLTYPRRLRVFPNEIEDILNEFIIRLPISKMAIKSGIQNTPEFKRLYRLHQTDIYAFYMEMELLHERVRLTKADYRQYYKEHSDNYTFGLEYLCREIRIPIQATENSNLAEQMEAKEKALKVAQEVYDKLTSGGNFEKLAEEYSSGTSAKNGGLLPWINKFEGGGQYFKALQNLQVGHFSEPVPGVKFILILKLEKTRSPTPPSYESIEWKIKRDYKGLREVQEASKLEDELVSQAHFRLVQQ